MSAHRQGWKADAVLTTIGEGAFLEDYARAIDADECREAARVVAIPDVNTPPRFYERCAEYRARGYQVVAPTVEEQDRFLKKLGAEGMIPTRSDNRRNVGFLLSLEHGADFLVAVDDDNLPTGAGFFRGHARVLDEPTAREVVESESGWLNLCALADCRPGPAWPRGFPYARRHDERTSTRVVEGARVRANAGLWLGEPDVDAATRLALRPRLAGPARDVVLGPRTWTPINSQNSAVHAEAVPAYYYIRMGARGDGWVINRYGDIFSGYFLQACMKHFGHLASAGTPLVRHERNPHDVLRDLQEELVGMLIVEELAAWITEVKLSGSTYVEAYEALSHAFEREVAGRTGRVWTPHVRAFCLETARLMRQWCGAVRALGVR